MTSNRLPIDALAQRWWANDSDRILPAHNTKAAMAITIINDRSRNLGNLIVQSNRPTRRERKPI